MSFHPKTPGARLTLTAALLLGLAACRVEDGPPSAEPLFVPVGTAPYEQAFAPAGADLPSHEMSIGPQTDDDYGYAERAYAVDQAFNSSPPDYAFAYEDARPWVWESQDDWRMYVEPIEAGYRYYYYQPGEAYPYFVREPDYGYGYGDGGVLVTIYDSRGHRLPRAYLSRNADRAGRYLWRARALREASARTRRIAVAEDRWAARRPAFAEDRAAWFDAARHQPDWGPRRARHNAKADRHFDRERERRVDVAARLEYAGDRRKPQWGRDDEPRRASQAEHRKVRTSAPGRERRERASPRRDPAKIHVSAAPAERRKGVEVTKPRAAAEVRAKEARAKPTRERRAEARTERRGDRERLKAVKSNRPEKARRASSEAKATATERRLERAAGPVDRPKAERRQASQGQERKSERAENRRKAPRQDRQAKSEPRNDRTARTAEVGKRGHQHSRESRDKRGGEGRARKD